MTPAITEATLGNPPIKWKRRAERKGNGEGNGIICEVSKRSGRDV